MTNINLKFLKALIIIDLMVITVSIIFFNIEVLWNTQIAFITAALVMFASMRSYRRMVNARVEHNIITIDDSKDTIDKLEDPFDLYSEAVDENDEEKDLKEVVKEERQKLKANRRSLGETLKDTKAALSIYRIGAYFILILGFLYLNRQGLLHIPSYIISLSLPMLIVVYVLLREKEEPKH